MEEEKKKKRRQWWLVDGRKQSVRCYGPRIININKNPSSDIFPESFYGAAQSPSESTKGLSIVKGSSSSRRRRRRPPLNLRVIEEGEENGNF